MKKHLGIFILAIAVVAVLLISTVTYTVDELKDICLIRTFGQITAVNMGKKDAGLNVKWPWPIQRLVRYDRRIHVFEGVTKERTTADATNLLVTMSCSWRIADAKQFQRKLEDIKLAEPKLRALLQDKTTAVIANRPLSQMVNTVPEQMKLSDIERDILEGFTDSDGKHVTGMREQALKDYGIAIVRVGFRSNSLPQKITEAVIESMKEERQRQIRRLKKEGEAEAVDIIARAESARDTIMGFARNKAQEIRTEGYKAAAKFYGKYGEDAKLSMFLRARDVLRTGLKDRSVILLDGSALSPVRWFRKDPSLSDLPGRSSSSSRAKPTPPKPTRPKPARTR